MPQANNRDTLPLQRLGRPLKVLRVLDAEGGIAMREFKEAVGGGCDESSPRKVLQLLQKRGYARVVVCITAEGRDVIRQIDAELDARRRVSSRRRTGGLNGAAP